MRKAVAKGECSSGIASAKSAI